MVYFYSLHTLQFHLYMLFFVSFFPSGLFVRFILSCEHLLLLHNVPCEYMIVFDSLLLLMVLGCLQFETIMNSASVNLLVCVLLNVFLLDIYLEVGLLSHKNCIHSPFVDIAEHYSNVVVPVYTPSSTWEVQWLWLTNNCQFHSAFWWMCTLIFSKLQFAFPWKRNWVFLYVYGPLHLHEANSSFFHIFLLVYLFLLPIWKTAHIQHTSPCWICVPQISYAMCGTLLIVSFRE